MLKKLQLPLNFQLLIVFFVLQGCASAPQSEKLLNAIPDKLPLYHELTSIPFFSQKAYQCGPAALSTMLHANNINIKPADLIDKVYLPKRKGSLQIEIISTARRYGLIPYLLRPQLEELLTEVSKGRPVLVFQNLGLTIFPQWHYAVVVGYDLNKQEIILRSGTEKRHISSIFDFEKSWLRAGHWSMLTLKPGELPSRPDEWRYVKAIIGFERLSEWEILVKAYRSGLDIWPNSLELNLGMGNYHYQHKRLELAMKFYKHILNVNPNYAPAHNNLAQVLYEQGNYIIALQHAKYATAQKSKHLTQYKKTMSLIKKKLNLN